MCLAAIFLTLFPFATVTYGEQGVPSETGPVTMEIFTAALDLVVAVIALIIFRSVGKRLVIYWDLRQKQRENDLAAAQEFHRLYSEFLAVWKLWNNYLEISPSVVEGRKELLFRACTAEGELESLFVRLASSRKLDEEQIGLLGRFRQGYQSLREAISDGKALDWRASSDPKYIAFKKLATGVALLIVSEQQPADSVARAAALIRITSNEWERNWVLAQDLAPGDPSKGSRPSAS